MRFEGAFRQLTVKLPRPMLSERLWIAERLTALDFSWRTGTGRLAFGFFKMLLNVDAVETEETLSRLQNVGADLLATALRDYASSRHAVTGEDGHRRNLIRAKEFIRSNLGNAALSPQAVAAALRVSTRTLYGVFAKEGITPRRWIQSARIDACRQDLEYYTQARRTVLDIAFARGFNDAAHFSRAFRLRYGMSPTDWAAKHRRR